jgi:hypothetical protein
MMKRMRNIFWYASRIFYFPLFVFLSCEEPERPEISSFSAPVIEIDSVGGLDSRIATIYGKVISGGGLTIFEKGALYSDSISEPTFGNCETASGGTGQGKFSVTLENLKSKKAYQVRLYARHAGDTSYTNVLSFISLLHKPWLDTIVCYHQNPPVFEPLVIRSSFKGMTGDSITEQGFVYSETGLPVIGASNFKPAVKKTTNIGGLKIFWDATFTNLEKGKKYKFRAYARNSSGVGYSNKIFEITIPE